MKHMNYNAAENQPHKYARPVTLDEMNALTIPTAMKAAGKVARARLEMRNKET